VEIRRQPKMKLATGWNEESCPAAGPYQRAHGDCAFSTQTCPNIFSMTLCFEGTLCEQTLTGFEYLSC
jgi:hypothetical protein